MAKEQSIHPIKANKPFLKASPHQRNPNNASPVGLNNSSGNYLNSDKDYSKWSQLGPSEINQLHSRDDKDISDEAHHHSLGYGHNQSSPGDHTHDGSRSRKLGHGLGLTISGSKGGNAALASLITLLENFIEFTDSTT